MKSSSVVRLALIGSVSVSLPALTGCGSSCSPIDTSKMTPQQIQQLKSQGKLNSQGQATCSGSRSRGFGGGYYGSSSSS